MTVHELTTVLRQLSVAEIRAIAESIRAGCASGEDDAAWWDATLAVERALRRAGRNRQASLAAFVAARAVEAAARDAGILGEDPDVREVARAASMIARALVAGELGHPQTAYLLKGCERLVSSPEVTRAA